MHCVWWVGGLTPTHTHVPQNTHTCITSHTYPHTHTYTQRQLDSMVSLHIRSRTFGPIQDAAHYMRALLAMYGEYRQKRREHRANPTMALNHTELQQKYNDNMLANFHKLVVMGLLIPEYDDGLLE